MALVPSPTILSTDEMGRVAPPIFTSVGQDAVNAPGDVFVVQSLLNDRLPKPHSPVPVNGVPDVGLTLAIEAYQAVVMQMNPPTGRVDPGSPTYYALAARPLVEEGGTAQANTPRYGHVGQIPPEIVEAALASRKRWKVPASVTMAQWVVESAWGAAMPPGSNNPFGMKAVGAQDSVESPTREVVNGESITITAKFRKFLTLAEAFDAHGQLLATGRFYTKAMQVAGDPEAFANALTGVYATDPKYGATLTWVMRTYNLLQYDQASP